MARYVFSDVHGRKDLYDQIMAFVKPDDELYFLGDAADRGPDGWEIIKSLLEDSRVSYLKGNHEDMLICATGIDKNGLYDNPRSLVYYNGGGKTFEDYALDPRGDEWIERLYRLPTYISIVNESGLTIHLSHAGFTPPAPRWNNYALLWDREHFFNKWPSGYDNDIIIHGHTNIPSLIQSINQINYAIRGEAPAHWDGGALYYTGTHKICIDCGSAFTGRAILLDIDTFDEHIFQCEPSELS